LKLRASEVSFYKRRIPRYDQNISTIPHLVHLHYFSNSKRWNLIKVLEASAITNHYQDAARQYLFAGKLHEPSVDRC